MCEEKPQRYWKNRYRSNKKEMEEVKVIVRVKEERKRWGGHGKRIDGMKGGNGGEYQGGYKGRRGESEARRKDAVRETEREEKQEA